MKKFSLSFASIGLLICMGSNVHAAMDYESFVLNQSDQSSVALTIYNNNFAVVNDKRNVILPTGLIELKYLDVAKTIEPSSVSTRSFLANSDAINSSVRDDDFLVLEQSYRYQVLNRQSLLDSYIGRKLKYSRELLEGSKYEKVLREGILLSTNPEIVEFGDVIEISPEGVVSMPHLPDGLNLRPTLVWLVENQQSGPQIIETRYIASNIRWQADYTILLDEKNHEFNLSSWVSINNQSGVDYKQAKVTLVAGEVNRAPSAKHDGMRELSMANSRMLSDSMSDSIQAKPGFEYHQYALPIVTDLKNKEDKQIRFIDASHVSYEKSYSFNYQSYRYQQSQLINSKAEVSIHFLNTQKNNLGKPLPNGKVRVYLSGQAVDLLAGEDMLSATAVGESVELKLGYAFDITSKRKQTSFRRLGDNHIETSYEIKLHNAKDRSVEVVVNEALQGEWKIVDQSDPSHKIDSTTLQFTVDIPKNSDKIIRYTAQSRF